MLKILAIGNSFSQDATAYLYDLAKSDNVELKVVNLYIGGCSLETHWNRVCDNKADYEYQLNGEWTGRQIGIHEALVEEEWDIITLQQCSGYSGLLETYYPYILELSSYVKKWAPKAKQLIHQTWAYEIDSNHEHFAFYHKNQEEMYQAIIQCYATVAKELSLEIIPCGEVVQTLRSIFPYDYKHGGISLCRDGFHMHLIYGRYALAATWYEYVVGGNILNNKFVPVLEDDISATTEDLEIIKNCVHFLVKNKRK